MSLSKADGTFEEDLNGGAWKKFLAPSSDIYSFAMHKKVAQQNDDSFLRFQVSHSLGRHLGWCILRPHVISVDLRVVFPVRVDGRLRHR